MFVTSPDVLQNAIWEIQQDLVKQVDYFKEIGKHLRSQTFGRTHQFRFRNDSRIRLLFGIENYSRYFDGRRLPGTRPFCLLDYFPNDFLMVVDESHVTFRKFMPCMVAIEVEKKTW
jgi:excinuclease ABC subunit B